VNLVQIRSGVPEIFHTQTKKTTAKDVLPNELQTGRQNHPTAVTECCSLLVHAASMLQCVMQQNGPLRRCRGVMGVHSAFCVPDDLDLCL